MTIMITGGVVQKDKLILTAESKDDVATIKKGLAGKNMYIFTSPYGNRLDLSVDKNVLIIKKNSGLILTYEEVRTVIKKIQVFERIDKIKSDTILDYARNALDSKLTMFYPDKKRPLIELAFSYNWASIEFDSKNFSQLGPEIRDTIEEDNDSTVKVFSNNCDIISIHNYAMLGLYINRKTFGGIANVLIGSNMIPSKDRGIFVNCATAFGLKSVIYMEARQLCKDMDETFDVRDDTHFSPLIGNKVFVREMMVLLEVLSEKGSMKKLKPNQVRLLSSFLKDEKSSEKYSLSDTIGTSIRSFVENFNEEITALSSSSTAPTPSNAKKVTEATSEGF